MSSESKSEYGFTFYCIAAVIIGICVSELIALFVWGKGVWLDKVSALLAIVGIYGLALGFFSKSKALSEFKQILTELTDPNPLIYMRSNSMFCAIVAQLGVQGSESRMEPECPQALWLLGLILWIPAAVVMIVYVIFHLFVIAPLSYIPTVVASAVIAKIRYSAGDIVLSFGDNKVSIKSIVSEDPDAIKGFVIGIPSLALSVLSHVAKLIT